MLTESVSPPMAGSFRSGGRGLTPATNQSDLSGGRKYQRFALPAGPTPAFVAVMLRHFFPRKSLAARTFPQMVSPWLWAAALALICAVRAPGQITIAGDVTGTGGTITFQHDITLTITTTVTPSTPLLVFSNWVTPDSTETGPSVIPSAFNYQINGGSVQSDDFSNLYDNLIVTFGDISASDGAMNFGGFPLTAGDTLTFKAGTWNFGGDPDFNPALVGTFTGNVYLADDNGIAISNAVAVPEPSTYAALAGLLALGLVWVRRRSRRA